MRNKCSKQDNDESIMSTQAGVFISYPSNIREYDKNLIQNQEIKVVSNMYTVARSWRKYNKKNCSQK